VGSHAGLADYGTYDMAGNVKEWCLNATSDKRYILGGAWNDPTYMFRLDPDARAPMERLATHGFRCALAIGEPDPSLALPIPRRGPATELLVSDEVFAAYRRLFSYDPSELAAKVEAVDESAIAWRRETVSFRAAYGNERVLAQILLPRDTPPPYQAVVWFPGNDAFFVPSSESPASAYLYDFLPRAGRAVVYPVYKGMYERRAPFSRAPNEWRDMLVAWSRDLGRTLDYLATRDDLDPKRLAYYGFSLGACYGPLFTAVDPRFEASILLAGGLLPEGAPENSVVSYAPRSRVPTLMINGPDDFILPLETSQRPLFALLGAEDADKRHALLPGGHIPSDRRDIIREVLDWLDRYLGPVGTEGAP
jgi:dipeptidyl aminopeptidase/acylaminoacyl peptidase